MPKVMLPTGKPRLSNAELETKIAPFNLDRVKYPVIVVGVRGYYRDSMGAPNVNDRGIYDDAIFVQTPSAFAAFNANTDPSIVRKGAGTGSKKGMACLDAGAYFVHKFDLHKNKYLALCQRLGNVTVMRDGAPPYADTGSFGINIHKGGFNTTSSEGCQTIHPSQWNSFITLVEDQARRYYGTKWNKTCIPYILMA